MDTPKIRVKAMCVVVRGHNEILAGLGRDDVKGEDFGRIIGGGIEFGETSESALRREFREELGSDLLNVLFVKVIENVFQYKGKPMHEIVFLYTGDLADKTIYEKESIKIVDGKEFDAVWVKLEDDASGKIKLYPEIDYKSLLSERNL